MKKYYFINKFDTNVIDKQDKQTSIIYRNYLVKKIDENLILKIKNYCKKKKIKFFLSNNIKLAIKLDLDGAYISAFDRSLEHLAYSYKKHFKIIGSAHNIKEIRVKLHMIGKLQTNKVKFAVQIFDFIHSVDSEKLAKKIAEEQYKINKRVKVFLQVNIGDESQKSGINKNEISKYVSYCKEIGLDLIGLMCIPPVDTDSEIYFKEMKKLNDEQGFKELSMGMSSDFITASKYSATYVRVGSSIFGQRF